MKKLPKKIFVILENAGSTDEYLSANADRNQLFTSDDIGLRKEVGEYQLVRRVECTLETTELAEVG